MTSNREDIDDVKAEIQLIKQELASAQQAEDLAQVDSHRRRLLQLENQLSSLREQQTILLRSSQQGLPAQDRTSKETLDDRQVRQPPVLNAAEQAADQVVGSLQSKGFVWLKLSKSETCTFQQLQQCTKQPGSWFGQAGVLLRDKTLVQYNTGNSNFCLPSAVCTAANRVCDLVDHHARRILQAISRSRFMGLASSSLKCILDKDDSISGQTASSCLDIAQYESPSQYQYWIQDAHIDRALLTLIWSNSTDGLQVADPRGGKLVNVKIPEGYMLVLTGYTLEHVTCGIFKAAPHTVVVPNQATNRISFAYKLRCPGDAVLNQYNNLSASNKHVDHKYMEGITANSLMRQFDWDRVSINQVGADLVCLGLSPEWQHSVNEWRTTRPLVDDDWIWHRLISTMGWQRPEWTIFFKTFSRDDHYHVCTSYMESHWSSECPRGDAWPGSSRLCIHAFWWSPSCSACQFE